MYTHPHYARTGIGRFVPSLCERAARSEGFTAMELMSTMSGEPLYRACGYEPGERITDDRGGVAVPLLPCESSSDEAGTTQLRIDAPERWSNPRRPLVGVGHYRALLAGAYPEPGIW